MPPSKATVKDEMKMMDVDVVKKDKKRKKAPAKDDKKRKKEIKEEVIMLNSVKLRSSDGVEFEVEAAAAKQMQAISDSFVGDSGFIWLDNLTGDVLAMVIQYCKKHALPSESNTFSTSSSTAATATAVGINEKSEAWDNDFVKDCGLRTLWDLKMAADYLKVEGLAKLTCKVMSSMIVGKTTTDIRSSLELKGDFTFGEEAEISTFDRWNF